MAGTWVLFAFASLIFTSPNVSAELHIPASTKVRVMVSSVVLPIKISGEDDLSVEGWTTNGFRKLPVGSDKSVKLSFGRDFWIANVKKIRGPLFELGLSTASAAEPISFDQKLIRLVSGKGSVKISGQSWPSPVYLLASSSREADAILSLDLEKYLEGVMLGEMPVGWPKEAMKAQAVAARSYALAQLESRPNQAFQLRGNIMDQVYLPNSVPQVIKDAVSDTRGEVLVQDGKFLKAYYHSDCGGMTEEPQNVWGIGAVKMSIVRDNFCSLRKTHVWSYTVSKLDLLRLFHIDSLKILTKSASGRVVKIQVMRKSSAGKMTSVEIQGQDLRKAIGFDKIKSTLFVMTQDENSVKFEGRGMGHGSGLCQWGARSMALNGDFSSEILKHYYPLAHVENLKP